MLFMLSGLRSDNADDCIIAIAVAVAIDMSIAVESVGEEAKEGIYD